MNSDILTVIEAKIAVATGQPWRVLGQQVVGGGCINRSYILMGAERRYFVKLNRAELLPMFAAEAEGLQALGRTGAIAVPLPVIWDTLAADSFLVLTDLDLGTSRGDWRALGAQLAALHRYPGEERFGWQRDNTIGATRQVNTWSDRWLEFFAEQRLGYQGQLAGRATYPRLGELLDRLPSLLDHAPRPALVHGDLWSGNVGFTKAGQPAIFDPAVYWADREVDLAMTELFGGFPADFYEGYQGVYPLDAGYQNRKAIYNLYHLMNHHHLFGGGYQHQVNRSIEQILAAR
jgi:fructosamine-3-kinase